MMYTPPGVTTHRLRTAVLAPAYPLQDKIIQSYRLHCLSMGAHHVLDVKYSVLSHLRLHCPMESSQGPQMRNPGPKEFR